MLFVVCCLLFVVCFLLFVLCCLFSVVCSLLFVGPLFFVVRSSFFVVIVPVVVVVAVVVVFFCFFFFMCCILGCVGGKHNIIAWMQSLETVKQSQMSMCKFCARGLDVSDLAVKCNLALLREDRHLLNTSPSAPALCSFKIPKIAM